MRPLLALLAIAAFSTVLLADGSASPNSDQAIRAYYKDFEQAWDKHDAKAVAQFYAADADVITDKGELLAGRDAIEATLSDAFDNSLKDSTVSVSIEKIRLIKPDIAIVDGDLIFKVGGTESNRPHLLSVLMKKDGKWITETTRTISYR
jgi:uncharacterized protein (TIGR02246 family)